MYTPNNTEARTSLTSWIFLCTSAKLPSVVGLNRLMANIVGIANPIIAKNSIEA